MLQIVLIVIITVVTAFHLWRQSQKVESFVGGIVPSAQLAPIIDDPADDPLDLPWIAALSAMDQKARYGQTCQVIYTEDGPCNTTIQTVSVTCEAGMPHTRAGDRIILPESSSLAKSYEPSFGEERGKSSPDREEIIRHELVHILQRRHADSWLAFYRRNWAFIFTPSPPQKMPQEIQDARRSNPDTWDLQAGGPWACWMHRWWPVPVYRNPENPQLRDAETVWWDAATETVLHEPPADWTAFFGATTQDEHPHELSAVMLVASDSSSEAGRRLQNWWRSEGRKSQVDTNSICPL